MTQLLSIAGLALALSAPALAAEPPETSSGSMLRSKGFKDGAPQATQAPEPETTAEPGKAPTPSAESGSGVLSELAALRERLSAMELRLGSLEQQAATQRQSPQTSRQERQSIASHTRAQLRQQASVSRQSWYGDVEVGAGEVVEELLSLSGDVHVRGTVLGDATTLSGTVYLYQGGRILGDAVSLNGDVIVEPDAVLEGEAHTLNGSLEVLPGGVLQATALPPDLEANTSWVGRFFMSLYRRLVFLLAFAGAGVLIVTLFQDRVARIAQYLEEEPGTAGLMGLAWSAGITVASVLFFWTVLGPLAGAALLGLAWMLGFVGLCQMLGDRLGLPTKHHGRWLTFLIGAVLISFLGALPWLGVLVVVAASVFGIGAALQTNFGSKPVS